MDDYRRIADRIAADIARGRLRTGQRLPPQRAFARRHGIAASTAERVYGELARRGLVVGEVGRGTFVRATAPDTQPGHALTETSCGPTMVNLELNYPSTKGQSELLAPVLAELLRPEALSEALRLPAPAAGTAAAREAVAGLLGSPDPDGIVLTGNGRQAIAATLASLVRPGDRIGVEPLTYPLVREVAARLGATLVPLATDARGPLPTSLAAAHRSAPLAALYLQPTLHNPTSRTLDAGRRSELAYVITDLGIPVVEDRVWSFLHEDDEPPFASLLPGLGHIVDSLSKRVAPGLTVGFAAVPPARAGEVARAVRSGGWSAGALALEAAVRWITDGTVARLTTAKRADARHRQLLATKALSPHPLASAPTSCFTWWPLPTPWRADTFTAAARARGIAVTPGPAFATAPSHTPDAVRLGLGSVPEGELVRALGVLAELVRGTPLDGSGTVRSR
ncbi:PLP-dependent aminotransferase family protein [Streptomyces sp. LaPpAH-108]|uniref:aminotransferase-like domain-containing protein n=1 Tax=Streptomyces sp. LaPpAH-108 TaxID=1155714 RepID=UPI0003667D55|nr:PLP-dependent aminotransferase family protein [Streptomyces sp. LaPpAH-108]